MNKIMKCTKSCSKYNIFPLKFKKINCEQLIKFENNLGGVLLRGGGLLKRLGECLLYPEYLRAESI